MEKEINYGEIKSIEEIITMDLDTLGRQENINHHKILSTVKSNVEEKIEDIELAFIFTEYWFDGAPELLFIHTKDEQNFVYGDIKSKKMLRDSENGIAGKIRAEDYNPIINLVMTQSGDSIEDFFLYDEDLTTTLNFEKINPKKTEAALEDYEIELQGGLKFQVRRTPKKFKQEFLELKYKLLTYFPLIGKIKIEKVTNLSTKEIIDPNNYWGEEDEEDEEYEEGED